MDKYVTLIGTEQVQIAANTMRDAAEKMQRAANDISYAMERHTEAMRQYISDLEMLKEQQHLDLLEKNGGIE